MPDLRKRWRLHLMVGMNLLVLLVVGIASAITLLGQRDAVDRLHRAVARQVEAALTTSLDQMQQALTLTARDLGEDNTAGDLAGRLALHPALDTLALIEPDGTLVASTARDPDAPDLRWADGLACDPACLRDDATLPGDRPGLALVLPAQDGLRLVAMIDPQVLWQGILDARGSGDTAVAVITHEGTLLAVSSGQTVATDPGRLQVFRAARGGQASARLYRGLQGDWAVGRAEPYAGGAILVETSLSALAVPLLRTAALWLIALVITALLGEWLVRRNLQPVIGPLELIRQGARAVATGDYRFRVRLPGGTGRELAELASAFNAMVERLDTSQRKLDTYTHEMQEIVDQRARELSRKALLLEVAAQVTNRIATNLDLRTLTDDVAALIQQRFEVYHVEILLVDGATGQIRPAGPQSKFPLPNLNARDADHSVIAWVARHGETRYVPDVTAESRYHPSPDLPASRSELAIPLKFDGRVIGVLNLEGDHRDAFPKDSATVLESLANGIAVSLHNAQTFSALEIANRDLAQATLTANQAAALKSRFLLNASHKLRTPLNTIIGYSETMLSGIYGALPDAVLDRQRRILENGRELQALIEDMFDLSAIEAGQMQLNLEWVSLPPLLEEVMNAARALHAAGYAGHTLDLRLDVPADLPLVQVDSDRLRYILITLMSNAVKFTPSGEVALRASFDDDWLYLRVHDSGPGITEDDQRYLFEPFQHQRGSVSRAGKGTGLGLPVSRLLAQRHGGDLTLESTPGAGTTFTLALPRRTDAVPGSPPPA